MANFFLFLAGANFVLLIWSIKDKDPLWLKLLAVSGLLLSLNIGLAVV